MADNADNKQPYGIAPASNVGFNKSGRKAVNVEGTLFCNL